jgi:hypothetical protein
VSETALNKQTRSRGFVAQALNAEVDHDVLSAMGRWVQVDGTGSHRSTFPTTLRHDITDTHDAQ